MNSYYEILKFCPLFRLVDQADYDHILKCLNAQYRTCQSGEYLMHLGDRIDMVGIVLEGGVEIIKETPAGNKYIVTILQPGDMFGEAIVCTEKRISPVSVCAHTNSVILFIPYLKIISTCSSSCHFHIRLIYNMMQILGEKNSRLNYKIDLLMLKGIQEKLAAFLLNEAKLQGKHLFSIDLNRNQLAEYLNISRPTMSRELGEMKNLGIIDYHKNTFRIIDYDRLTQIIS